MTGPGDRSGREDAQPGAYAPGGGFRKGSFGVSGSGDTSGFGGLVRVEPGGAVALHSTDRPYGGYFDEVTDALIDAVGQATYDAAVRTGDGESAVVAHRDCSGSRTAEPPRCSIANWPVRPSAAARS